MTEAESDITQLPLLAECVNSLWLQWKTSFPRWLDVGPICEITEFSTQSSLDILIIDIQK